jgi:hypothetical protein
MGKFAASYISAMDGEGKRQGLEQVRARIEDGILATLAGFPADFR